MKAVKGEYSIDPIANTAVIVGKNHGINQTSLKLHLGVRWLATAFEKALRPKAAASCRTPKASPPTKSMRHKPSF
jgi:hypothetical protein